MSRFPRSHAEAHGLHVGATIPAMCGRFTLSSPLDVYAEYFEATELRTEALHASWNVAPTDPVYAVAEHDGRRQLGAFRWGLVPHWADDARIGAKLINARAESLLDKPAFREAFARRRCLVPADGFYEWERLPEGKLPHYFFHQDGSPLAFAGLWAGWTDKGTGERLRTCAIVTGEPNELLAPIHDRMPVILGHEAWEAWLDPANHDTGALAGLLVPYPAARLVEHAVSSLVNSVKNNLPELVAPLRPE